MDVCLSAITHRSTSREKSAGGKFTAEMRAQKRLPIKSEFLSRKMSLSDEIFSHIMCK